jgi:fibronectin type 3 domain-containing protein
MIARKVLLIICGIVLFSSPALAAHLDLAWHPNTEPDLAGYRVYYGTISGDYTDYIDVAGSTSVRITDLVDDTEYFVALTAYDIDGNESDFSGEVSAFPTAGDDPAPSETQSDGGIIFDATSEKGCFISRVTTPQ